MHLQPAIDLLPLLVMLAVAATSDWRRRVIPNWLVCAIAAAGLAQAIFHPQLGLSVWMSLAGLLLGFVIMLPQFVLNAIRGGDVKLMAALGAWTGPLGILAVFVIEKVYALGIVLVQATAAGRLQDLLFNSARLAMCAAHVRALGTSRLESEGYAFRSIDRPLPYAVPVLLAMLTLLLWGFNPR